MWMQSQCKKGKRPLDKVSEGSNSINEGMGEGFDLEENVQQDAWIDERSSQTYGKYRAYVLKKHGDERPSFDYDGWHEATGGKNKGKLYGLNNVADPLYLITGVPSNCSSNSCGYEGEIPEIQRLNGIIEDLVAEREMEKAEKEREKAEKEMERAEKEREKAEKEKEKVEKENLLARVMNIEALLKSMAEKHSKS